MQIVVQPEVEINKSFAFKLLFKVKPDTVWAEVDEIDGLEMAESFNTAINRISTSTSTDGKEYKITTYHTECYTEPVRLGKIDFPIIYYRINGKQFQTQPLSITSVTEIKIDKETISLQLHSDKKKYKMEDLVRITLFQYSRIDLVNRFSKREIEFAENQLKLKGENNTINISFEQSIDDIVGIPLFEKEINKNFTIVDFDFNPFDEFQMMEKIDKVYFIKTKVFEILLQPKSKGEFEIGPSEFGYYITKNQSDYMDNLEPTDKDGMYRITRKNSRKMFFKSNTITFSVK